jgi:selenocysteine lyase/cysteine desulfurase
MLSDASIQSIRSRFPIFKHKIYLNSCSQGALSDAVEAAFGEYLKSWHAAGSPWDVWVQRYEEIRAQFARFINAEPDEVAVVSSASAGINSVASAFDFKQRNKVVMGEYEFPTMGHIWLAQKRRGAEIAFIDAKHDDISAEAYAKVIDEETAIVPVTHICFKNGFRSDVARIAQAAHAKGALVFMDDYQDCGTRPIDVKALGVDFYVAGTLKYLLGPPGLAFLYVNKNSAAKLNPTITGWFAQSNPFAFDVKNLQLASAARRFETGTPPIPNLYAASAGIALLQEIGMAEVAEQVGKLAKALIDGAREMGIHVKTPLRSKGPLVVLKSTNVDAVIQKLAAKNIVVSGRLDGLRISFHVHNTLDDVKQVLGALKECSDLMVRERQPV